MHLRTVLRTVLQLLWLYFLHFVVYPLILLLVALLLLTDLFFRIARPIAHFLDNYITDIAEEFLDVAEQFFDLVLWLLDNKLVRRLIRAALQDVLQ
jgi:hypothetical protein